MSGDPLRLDLSDDAPALAIEALRDARRDAPDAARMRAIEAAVLAKLGAPPDGGGGDGGSGGEGAPGPGPSSLSAVVKAGAAAIAVVAVVVAVVVATRPAPLPRTVAPPAPPSVAISAPPAPSATPSGAELPTLAVEDLPGAPDALMKRPATAGTSASTALDPAGSERVEIALLDGAQASLRARPVEALAACDEHARRFPQGTLVQEREVIAVDALVRLGRRDEAEARAARFRQAFPRSGHVRRIDALLAR